MRRILPSLVVAAGLAAATSAQTADELVAKSLAARGGLDKIKAVQTLRMTGTLGVNGMEMPIVLEIKRPASIRTEVTFQGLPAVQATDGKQAWGIVPIADSQPQALPPDAVKELAKQADFEGPLADYKGKGNRVELVGLEKAEGKDAYRLKVTQADGSVEYHILDAASSLPIRVESQRTILGQEVQGQSTLGDYREVGGVRWPYRIQNSAKNMPNAPPGQAYQQAFTFSKIEVNPALDDSRFRMPAPATAPSK